MKKIIGIFVIVICVFALDYIAENHTNKTVEEMTDMLFELDDEIGDYKKEDSMNFNGDEKAKKLIKMSNKILKTWREKDRLLSFYIEHDEIEKVSDKINTFNRQIEIYDYSEASVSIIETEFLLKHITEKQSFCLENLF